MPERMYVRTTDVAHRAVAEIQRLVKGGFVDPIVSFDFETMPVRGLEGYPGTTFDDQGERIRPKKKDYLEYAQARWFESFSVPRLASLGLRVPVKTTTGNEAPGVPAKQAWTAFWKAVQQVDPAKLERCRWQAREEVLGHQQALEQEIADLEAQIAELTGVRGKKKAVAELEKRRELYQWRLEHIPGALDRVEHSIDLRLLTHIVAVGVENRVKVDPIQPGLDPYTSDFFTVQVTLRRTVDRELLTWVFNCNWVALKDIEPVFRLGRAYTYLAHNAKFDLKLWMVKMSYRHVPRNVFCTRIGSRMLYLGLKRMSHSLKACAKRFVGQEMDKGVRDTFIGVRRLEPTQEQIDYGAFDTEVLFAIYDKQMAAAKQRGQVELLQEFSKLSWITALWEARGYQLDVEKWLDITAQSEQDRDLLARELEELLLPAGYREQFTLAQAQSGLAHANMSEEELETLLEAASELAMSDDEDGPAVDLRADALIRISQGKLVAERLREVLGEDVAARAFPDGKLSLEKTARGGWERAYRDLHNGETHPFFALYAKWSKRAKQASTYGRLFLWNVHPLTGAIHPNLVIAGTDTGRYSSNRPNLLNIPAAKEEGDPDYRGAFVAPDGQVLLGADFESMEFRIAVNVTRDRMGKKMVEGGKDGHTFTAAMMFHIRKAAVREARKVKDTFKYGTSTFEIDVWEVPEAWNNEQVAEFALADEFDAIIASVPKKTTRTVAKMVTFLWLFRGTAFTLAARTGLPVKQCEEFFARFDSVYSDMAVGMDRLAEGVLRNIIEGNDGYLYAYSEAYGNLRRWFVLPESPSRRNYPAGVLGSNEFEQAQKEYKRRLNSIKREAANVPMQGGNAVITARVLNRLVDEGLHMDALPFLAVYDEVIMAFPDSLPPRMVKVMLEDAMKEEANEYMTFVPAGAEAELDKVGACWVKS